MRISPTVEMLFVGAQRDEASLRLPCGSPVGGAIQRNKINFSVAKSYRRTCSFSRRLEHSTAIYLIL